MTTFIKIFYVNFKEIYGGKGMTLIELMVQHRRIFSLIDNLHDLCCRGTKDYKEALAQVQDYNMTKILTRKCSVPSKCGDIKQANCDFNILYNCQMDIEIYNYIDILLHEYRKGTLNNKKKDEESEAGNGMNAGVVALLVEMAPEGMTFKRINHDFMNNFFVNIVARSYTDIEEFLRTQEENKDQNKQVNQLKELEKVRDEWKTTLVNEAQQQFSQFDEKILKNSGDNKGEYTISNHVIGAEESFGIKMVDKQGKDANIDNLIDLE